MKRHSIMDWAGISVFIAIAGVSSLAFGQAPASDQAPARARARAPAQAAPAPTPEVPEVKPAAPGVFKLDRKSATRFQLTVTGHAFTSRGDIEKYLAYRAAEITMQQGDSWFNFVEHRAKGDKAPVPKPDPAGVRYSFRMEFFRPVWRYQTAGSANWTNWSPFSGDDKAFWANAIDPKKVTLFEVSADIMLHKGMVQDDNPLAFDASALSDYLINQVEPPQ